MWKNILALSGLCLSIAVCANAIAPAFARTGTMSLGSNTAYSMSAFTTDTTESLQPVVGQERIMTDIYLSAQPGYDLEVIITTSGGAEIGRFKAWNYSSYPAGPLNVSLESGLRVPEGESVTLNFNGRGVYTLSGYLAQP